MKKIKLTTEKIEHFFSCSRTFCDEESLRDLLLLKREVLLNKENIFAPVKVESSDYVSLKEAMSSESKKHFFYYPSVKNNTHVVFLWGESLTAKEELSNVVRLSEEIRDNIGFLRVNKESNKEITFWVKKLKKLEEFKNYLLIINKQESPFFVYKKTNNRKKFHKVEKKQCYFMKYPIFFEGGAFNSWVRNMKSMNKILKSGLENFEIEFCSGHFVQPEFKILDNGKEVARLNIENDSNYPDKDKEKLTISFKGKRLSTFLLREKDQHEIKEKIRGFIKKSKEPIPYFYFSNWCSFVLGYSEVEIENLYEDWNKRKSTHLYNELVYKFIVKAESVGIPKNQSRKILRRLEPGLENLKLFIRWAEERSLPLENLSEVITEALKWKSDIRLLKQNLLGVLMVEKYDFKPHEYTDFFFDKKSKEIFCVSDENSNKYLHDKYGGELLYRSYRGFTGCGYVPKDSNLVRIRGYRKFEIPEEIPRENNFFVVTKTWGQGKFPLVIFYKNKRIYFIQSSDTLCRFLDGFIPEEDIQEWCYPYLGGELKFSFWKEKKDLSLPNNIKLFIKNLMGSDLLSLEGYSTKKSRINLYRQLNISSSGVLYSRIFNLPIKKIKLSARFKEGAFFEWPQGWTSTKNFLYKKERGKIIWFYYGNPSEMLEALPNHMVEVSGELNSKEEENEKILILLKDASFNILLENFHIEIPALKELECEKKTEDCVLKETEIKICEKNKRNKIFLFIKNKFLSWVS